MVDNDESSADPRRDDEPFFVHAALLQQAEERCRTRLSGEPDNREVLRSLAEIYRKQGNLSGAAAVYAQLFALDPNDQEAGYLSAVLGGTESPSSPGGLRAAPFVLVKDFLPRDFHDTLLPFADARRDKFVLSRVGRRSEYKANVRQTLEFVGTWEGAERFARAVAKIPNLLSRLNLDPFPAEFSAVRIRAYLDGHFFRAHIDAEPGAPSASRVYNFVYYFHRMPRPYSGGELLLFDSDPDAITFTRGRFTRVIPEDNSIIVFPCAFFHSVIPVKCPSGEFADSRFVINGHVSRRTEAAAGADASG